MSKKIIFTFVFFLCAISFLLIASPVLAGSITGNCRCCPTSEKSVTDVGDLGPADNLKFLRDRCQAHCTPGCADDYEIVSESCVVSTEVVTRVANPTIIASCEAPPATTPAPAPATTPTPTKTYKAIPTKGIDLPTPLGTTSVPIIIGKIIKSVLGIVGSIALLMFIYGGFMWLMSAGSPERVKKGQQALVWATIGLVVIFTAYAMVNFVINSLTGAGGGGGDRAGTTDKTDIKDWLREHPTEEWRENPFEKTELKEFLEVGDISEEEYEGLTGVGLD